MKAAGDRVQLIVDGEVVAEQQDDPGELIIERRFSKPGCHVLRAVVDEGISGPVYVGCAGAAPSSSPAGDP